MTLCGGGEGDIVNCNRRLDKMGPNYSCPFRGELAQPARRNPLGQGALRQERPIFTFLAIPPWGDRRNVTSPLGSPFSRVLVGLVSRAVRGATHQDRRGFIRRSGESRPGCGPMRDDEADSLDEPQ